MWQRPGAAACSLIGWRDPGYGLPRACDVPARRVAADETVLLIDAANVIGSRPTGWWRDRAGAARTFVGRVRASTMAGALAAPVVVVLEGRARSGAPEGVSGGVEVVHAPGAGDDALAARAARADGAVVLVTADRALAARARLVGADVVGPSWLVGRLRDFT